MATNQTDALTDFWVSFASVSSTVGRANYAKVGFSLASIKYIIEFGVVLVLTGEFFSPSDFVNPWLSSKASFLIDRDGGSWIGIGWILFTLPFVWIAVAMSVRRAADVGITPWCGLLILFPLINLAVMAVLAVLPTGMLHVAESDKDKRRAQMLADAYRPPPEIPRDQEATPATGFPPLLLAWIVGCATQFCVGSISIWALETYGFILFFATPVIAGAASGYVLNRNWKYSVTNNVVMIFWMNVFTFVLMLFAGLDGAVCLIMAIPLLTPLSAIGALVGRAIATARLRGNVNESQGLAGLLIFLPLTLGLDSLDVTRPLHRVTTIVEIDAPIEEVWNQVITFPEITERPAWYFRLGIAAPMRARIDGQGIGACRYCEFTTGEFVEPITTWKPPHELAFDVASQPYPMEEWTPIPHLHPPHLDTGFVSERGQFLLESLADGSTRLSGSTWYRIDVRPRLYWKVWADAFVHRIHLRVLDHIRRESESS